MSKRCKICHKFTSGGHPRDGSDKCWCSECDRCGKLTSEELDDDGFRLCPRCRDTKF